MGATEPSGDELIALAERLAVEMVARLGGNPLDDDGPRGERDLDGAEYTLADAAGFDAARLAAMYPPVPLEEMTLAQFIAFGARHMVHTAAEPDDERAAHLARLACQGIPGRPESFAPRHVRRALELLDEVHVNLDARGDMVVDVVDARLWLLDFAEQACALT